MSDAAAAYCSPASRASSPRFSSYRPPPSRTNILRHRVQSWRTLPFSSYLFPPSQSSCHDMKVRHNEMRTLRHLPWATSLFRVRLIARAEGLMVARAGGLDEEEAGKTVHTRPVNAMQYSFNGASEKGQQSARDIQYVESTKEVSFKNEQIRDMAMNKQAADMDAPQRSLEEDYGRLKEQVENDRRIQLASKQGSDVESRTDTLKPLKRSKIIAKQVISQSSAQIIGFMSQLWVSARLFRVAALEVRPSLLSGEIDRVLLADVCQIGDVVLVSDESALENEMSASDCETLVGYDVVTEDGNYIGKIRDYSFDLQDGKLTSLDFDSVGFSLVPSSLISTYRLDAEEVVEVLTDSILVKGGAESRIKRLTKGLWQLSNAEEQRRSQKMARSRLRNRRFPESTDFDGQARPLPLSMRPRYFEGLDVREGPADRGSRLR